MLVSPLWKWLAAVRLFVAGLFTTNSGFFVNLRIPGECLPSSKVLQGRLPTNGTNIFINPQWDIVCQTVKVEWIK